MFGWCLDGDHLGCRATYVSQMGVRKGEVVECDCPCHHRRRIRKVEDVALPLYDHEDEIV